MINAFIQSNYTGPVGLLCDQAHNIYFPCNFDNGGTIETGFEAKDEWNACELGAVDIAGYVTSDGVCHCHATVEDGNANGTNDDYGEWIWNSDCGANALYLVGDETYAGFCP